MSGRHPHHLSRELGHGFISVQEKVWKIVGARLCLNLDSGVQETWERDIPGNISRANKNWPRVLGR